MGDGLSDLVKHWYDIGMPPTIELRKPFNEIRLHKQVYHQ